MQFQFGDMLVRHIKGPLPMLHFGVYLGEWGPYSDAVFHNSIGKGCCVTSFTTFAAGKPILIASRGPNTREGSEELLLRVESLLGKIYRPIGLNCETAANYVHYGVAFSQSVQAAT